MSLNFEELDFRPTPIGDLMLRRRRMAELACENLLAGLAGERLPHPANPAVYQDG